ncbi:MAG TPA: hypothetical protein VEU09_03315 [Candidatus Binatia bacterium]|nr:hypothetical protein [Candidatus Binatia bacterium]
MIPSPGPFWVIPAARAAYHFLVRAAARLWYPSRVTRATTEPADLETARARLREILLERDPEGAVLIARLLDPVLTEHGARASRGVPFRSIFTIQEFL